MTPLKAQHNFDNFNFVAFAFNAHKITNAICNIKSKIFITSFYLYVFTTTNCSLQSIHITLISLVALNELPQQGH